MIPIRLWLELGAAAVIVVGFLWYRHSLIVEGENTIRIAQQEAANEQAGKDAKTAQETVGGLNAEIAHLRAQPQPAPVVRLCSNPRPVPASAAPGRAQPGEPASAGSVPSVPEGDRAGPNVGPVLQQLAEACDLLSAHDRAMLIWARGIAR